jgi:hypothetical protein
MCWNAPEVRKCKAGHTYVLNWLVEHDLMPDDGDLGSVPTWRISMCLQEFQAKRRAELAAKQAKAEAKEAAKEEARRASFAGALAPEAGTAGAPKKKHWTGTFSGKYYLQGLTFGRRYLKSPIKTEDIDLSTSWDGGRQQLPSPAPSTSIFMVVALEMLLLRSGTNIVHQHVAAAYLFLCYACMRCAQAQTCWITGILEGDVIEGYVIKEKNPHRKKRHPRPFWAALMGAIGTRLWFDVLMSTLRDVSDGCYIFRAFSTGSVFTASHLVDAPLRCGAQLLGAMHEILQLACGFLIPKEVIQLYTEHSPRHFLNETGRARNETPACRHEVGRWSLSVAQIDTLRPFSGAVHAHAVRLMQMPDRYSQEAQKLRPIAILRRQMAAVRELVTRQAPTVADFLATFPTYGGWEHLEVFKPTGGEHED